LIISTTLLNFLGNKVTKTKAERSELRKQQRKLFVEWKKRLTIEKLSDREINKRAKSFSRKRMSIED
jgi:hypothetical protein